LAVARFGYGSLTERRRLPNLTIGASART
jgi:hypothetical protein